MKQHPIKPGDMKAWDAYEKRVLELEAEGMTTSDAQGVANVELMMAQAGRKAEPVVGRGGRD